MPVLQNPRPRENLASKTKWRGEGRKPQSDPEQLRGTAGDVIRIKEETAFFRLVLDVTLRLWLWSDALSEPPGWLFLAPIASVNCKVNASGQALTTEYGVRLTC